MTISKEKLKLQIQKLEDRIAEVERDEEDQLNLTEYTVILSNLVSSHTVLISLYQSLED